MNSQYDHNLISSFYLWLDDFLVNKNNCSFTGINQIFEYYEANDIPSNMNAYYSQSNQFSCGHEAAKDFFYKDGNIIYQDVFSENKVLIDNNNSRILIDKQISEENFVYSGNFIEKEINLYISDQTEEDIIINTNFIIESGQSYLEYVDQVSKKMYKTPCVFIINDSSYNKGFAFGGTKETTSYIKSVIFASNLWQLNGILSIFRDASEKHVNLINNDDFPYGEFWHCKSGIFNYSEYSESKKIDKVFIKKADVYKLKDAAGGFKQKVAKNLYIGLSDFEISSIRET